jgi:hypothetical protein
MTIRVTALDRGGYSAFGGAYYDPRPVIEGGRVVKLDAFSDEVIDVVCEFTTAPTDFDYEEEGIDISTPVISGNTITFQIQGIASNGTLALLAMFGGGAQRRVNFIANPMQFPIGTLNDAAIIPTDDDDVDYGVWG